SFLQAHFRLACLILEIGDSFHTAITIFRFRKTVALTAPISLAFIFGEAVILTAPSFRRLFLRIDPESIHGSRSATVLASMVEFGRAFSLTPAEDDVVFRWMSDSCGDGGCMSVR
ncbi:hypothetical protein IGI04_005906, partial [Brassica rapa subsp. trilocularis]